MPRVLLTVEDAPALPFGAGAGRRHVRSRRTNQEKSPWKEVESIVETVENDHIYPLYVGESVAHYRTLDVIEAVLPIDENEVLTEAQISTQSGLSNWWDVAQSRWAANKPASDNSNLLMRIDYHSQLSSQLPIPSHRVLYTSSGSNLAATRIEGDRALVDKSCYWAKVASASEGRYLVGILNSELLLERVRPLQAIGLLGHVISTRLFSTFHSTSTTTRIHITPRLLVS